MNTSNSQPLKRHPALIPLSHDHHQGLLLVWKIRQGIALGVSSHRISNYIQYFSQQDLLPHFHKEESILIKELSPSDSLALQMIQEHDKLRETLQLLKNDSNNLSIIQTFSNLLEAHIRFEERILFPHIQDVVELDTLSQKWENKNATECEIDQKWDDHFWIKE